MGVKELAIRKICGDGLSLNLRSNEQILEVTGDGCSITMSKNRGSVKIIGDGCRLRIDQNMGNVEYTGDGGRVVLGSKSIKDKVKYVGDGGRVSFDGESRTKSRKSKGVSKEEAGKGMDERRNGSGKGTGVPKSEEETENTSNERKEAKLNRSGFKEEKTVNSARTRIVTTFECDEKIAKKWFVNPEAVVRTFDGASFVKIVPKQSKTKFEVK